MVRIWTNKDVKAYNVKYGELLFDSRLHHGTEIKEKKILDYGFQSYKKKSIRKI